MYVCMYICMYVCIYVCMFVCMYVCMYVCMLFIYACMYVFCFVLNMSLTRRIPQQGEQQALSKIWQMTLALACLKAGVELPGAGRSPWPLAAKDASDGIFARLRHDP